MNRTQGRKLTFASGSMSSPTRLHPADVLGFSHLAIDATSGMVGLVEAMHRTIAGHILPGTPAQAFIAGTVAAAYGAVRAITGLVGGGIDAIFPPLSSTLAGMHSSPEREAMLAAVNGIVGDHLDATQNPLAIPLRLRWHGRPLPLERRHLADAIPQPSGKLLVLVHGLCMNDLHRSGLLQGV